MKICILDDHRLFAEVLENVLPLSFKEADIRVFSDPELFLSQKFQTWVPDLTICDLLWPAFDGLEIVRKILEFIGPSCKIVMVTGITDAATVENAMREGANAYVSKEEPMKELETAIMEVLAGRNYISKTVRINVLESK